MVGRVKVLRTIVDTLGRELHFTPEIIGQKQAEGAGKKVKESLLPGVSAAEDAKTARVTGRASGKRGTIGPEDAPVT